jgi:hypothetical protein
MSSDKESKKYKAMLVFEVMGRPKEHLAEALNDIIKKVESEKGISIEYSNINEPRELEKKKGFFTTFAEVEVNVEELTSLILIMFKYMPSHVELISPEKLVLENNSFSDLLNETTRRLHGYEELARVFQIEKKILENKIKELEDKK